MRFLSQYAAYEADECSVHDYLMMGLSGFDTVHKLHFF